MDLVLLIGPKTRKILSSTTSHIMVFVRDGILFVADYNSTQVGVVVVVVVVSLFCNGIT